MPAQPRRGWPSVGFDRLSFMIAFVAKKNNRVKYIDDRKASLVAQHVPQVRPDLPWLPKENPPANLRRIAMICSVDINGLKKVNDTLGHKVGDLLILRTCHCVKCTCRTEDVICRIGGDEFAVIFPKTDEKTAKDIVTRLSDWVASDNRDHPDIPLSIAIGTATAVQANSLAEHLALADQRMYEHKREQKQVVLI
jgi:diguanylate cyclase (GGDEF)-like protein